ncbi:hypothetical protein EJ05DRAFT_513886 [Pseudovirgaria hyperparasitica]|uniref:Uncharacterized protein n=1 Tax=Pseudovirgaria hyperparasitica TaxID=470096 RepID=A0A6A6VXN3_9PEZI|nr:uncharacterized protein EJ05DRAFT_513886 [Pseudovirgaria hyperparasitica]KAF2754400.1 hypothetical protein EJ05DRAFT_513886 [Pseudovirgaria hyperparasitica]
MPPKVDLSGMPEHSARMLALAWLCMDTEPKIDTAKLSQLSGYTLKSTAEMLRVAKKNIRAMDTADGKPVTEPTSKAAKPVNKVKATAGNHDKDEDNDLNESVPTVKAIKGRKRKAYVDEDEDVPAKRTRGKGKRIPMNEESADNGDDEDEV